MLDVNNPCSCLAFCQTAHVCAGVTIVRCPACYRQDVAYSRPDTGNHPDHPPVPGGYRGATVDGQLVVLGEGRALQVINPGLATEAVIDVPAELDE